jgi:creatinine amidohydrolase
MQAAHPTLVRSAAIANFASVGREMESRYRHLSTQRPAPLVWQAQDLNATGAVGDATQASADKGEALLAHGARAFCELLADVATFDLTTLGDGPGARG